VQVSTASAAQYATDANLRARQSLWTRCEPPFSLIPWVLDVAGLDGDEAVLDVGCGNGAYLTGLGERGHRGAVTGVDASPGMLAAVTAAVPLVVGDAQRLPFASGSFDVVLAPHMLYHVPDRQAAARELRRVLRSDGRCVVVTNGVGNFAELRDVVEAAAGGGWRWQRPAETVFSLENGGAQLATAFDVVERIDTPTRTLLVDNPDAVAAYLESIRDHYEEQLPPGRWDAVVEAGRDHTTEAVAAEGALRLSTSAGAFVCR
jgi:SAM-dependent methyltransferase